jgi:vesicle coat complex subunit
LFFFRYATEVDVDFVRKSVRAIGRCAIKVEQSAERCVSTLLDLIQTKVNYVVQVRYNNFILSSKAYWTVDQ